MVLTLYYKLFKISFPQYFYSFRVIFDTFIALYFYSQGFVIFPHINFMASGVKFFLAINKITKHFIILFFFHLRVSQIFNLPGIPFILRNSFFFELLVYSASVTKSINLLWFFLHSICFWRFLYCLHTSIKKIALALFQ